MKTAARELEQIGEGIHCANLPRFDLLLEYDTRPHRCWAASNAIDYGKFYSRSRDAVIRVYDEAGNVIETHEHAGDFKEF